MRCIQANQPVHRVRRNNIRCVLELEGKQYLLLQNTQSTVTVIRSQWNPYRGFWDLEEDVPQSVLSFAQKIMELHLYDRAQYPLRGEWYSIKVYSQSERTRWKLKRIKEKRTTTFISLSAFLAQLLVTMTFAVLMLAWNIDTMEAWLYSLLPVDREMLAILSCTIELIGVLLLFLLFDWRRDLLNLCLNSLVPIGTVILAGMLKCYWWMWIVVPIVLCLMFFVSKGGLAMIEGRHARCADCVRYALILLAALLFLLASVGWLNAYSHVGQATDLSDRTNEEIEKAHWKNCGSLEKKVWRELTVQEKVDLLQAICDYECKMILGCEPVTLRTGLTGDDTVLGEYSNPQRCVTINEKHLIYSDVERVLCTALHEARHAYQHSLVEMYASVETYIKDEYKNLLPLKQAQSFSEEFKHYCSGEDDFDQYYNQDVEEDSREWAVKRINEFYMMFIEPDR